MFKELLHFHYNYRDLTSSKKVTEAFEDNEALQTSNPFPELCLSLCRKVICLDSFQHHIFLNDTPGRVCRRIYSTKKLLIMTHHLFLSFPLQLFYSKNIYIFLDGKIAEINVTEWFSLCQQMSSGLCLETAERI